MHRLTSKRQVTIPQAVCGQLGLEPGDMVEVFARDGVAHLVRMSGESLAGEFAGFAKGQEIPESNTIKQVVKSRAAKKFKASDDSH